MILYRAKIERLISGTGNYEGVWLYSNEGEGGEYGNLGAFFNRIAVYDRDDLVLVPPQRWTGRVDKDGEHIWVGGKVEWLVNGYIYTVIFDVDDSAYKLSSPGNMYDGRWLLNADSSDLEVVPELLEAGK